MALLLARSILENGGVYEPQVAARAYVYWLRSQPFDIGHTTATALRGFAAAASRGGDLLEAGRRAASPESQANGSLMRISPLAIWGHALPPQRLAELARAESELTHPHRVCQDACAVYTVTVARAIATGATAEVLYRFALEWVRSEQYEDSVVAALAGAAEPVEQQPALDGDQQGWVLLALRNAFHQLLHAPSFEEGLVRTVMRGGDTDTNGAIAGALLGAVHGYRAIPSRWSRAVLTCRPVEGTSQPRPPSCWPVDALVLAERLAANGAAAASR
jgi:ADP-ribosyl-[dinitrogen reductase] hydrolase